MQRKTLIPNRDLAKAMEELRFDIYNLPSVNNRTYFSDNVYYEFTRDQIESIYEASKELHFMCLDYVSDIIKIGDYENLGLNRTMIEVIEATYKKSKNRHVYGRFDLAFNSELNTIKMLEYNADTPTSLYESSVVQWDWKEHYFKEADQYNSIHEELIERWKAFPNNMYFTAHDEAGKEDWITLYYLLDTYLASGKNIGNCINLTDLGIDSKNRFVDLSDNVIENIFKLYPWEFMQEEAFIDYAANTNFIEPSWKILLSNKSLLPELWQRHKNHPLLLASYFDRNQFSTNNDFIKKPVFSREGANVSSTNPLDSRNKDYELYADNLYDSTGYIFQKDAQIPLHDGYTPVIGSWVVGNEPCGINIREDIGFTRNTSAFVSHIFN